MPGQTEEVCRTMILFVPIISLSLIAAAHILILNWNSQANFIRESLFIFLMFITPIPPYSFGLQVQLHLTVCNQASFMNIFRPNEIPDLALNWLQKSDRPLIYSERISNNILYNRIDKMHSAIVLRKFSFLCLQIHLDFIYQYFNIYLCYAE